MPTLVSSGLAASPALPSAINLRLKAVTSRSASLAPSDSRASASRIWPPPFSVPMLTEPATSMSPTVMFWWATSIASPVPPALSMTIRLLALCTIAPAKASISMLPARAAVLLVRMSAVPVRLTERAASRLILPLALKMSAWAVMSASTARAEIRILPLPWALTAVSSAGAVPLPSVIEPAVVLSTMAPLPPVVRTSLCVASPVIVSVAPSLPTRFTLTATSSTLKASASSTKMPPLAAHALSFATVVSKWFTLSAIDVPAFRRKALAVMFWLGSLPPLTKASASKILPAVAVMLTWPSINSISPTVTSVAASRRAVALAPVLKIRLVALCVIEPVPACTSMLPPVAAALVVRMSAVPVKDTLLAASTLTLPLPLTISALAAMSLVVLPAVTPA